jgi:hypothetical protein
MKVRRNSAIIWPDSPISPICDTKQSSPADWITIDELVKQYGAIDLLKMDIEGYEYDVIASWTGSRALPRQMAVELHYAGIYYGTNDYNNIASNQNLLWPLRSLGLSDLSLFVSHIVDMGYSIVSKEDNPLCPHCSELTFQKVC